METGLRSGELVKLQPYQVTIEQVEDKEGTPDVQGVAVAKST